MQALSLSERVERKLCGFVTYHFVIAGVIWLFSGIQLLKGYGVIVSIINWLIYFIWLANIIPDILKRSKKTVQKAYVIFFVLYLLSIMLSMIRGMPIDILLKHDALWTFVYYLPVGLTAFSIRNHRTLYEMLYNYSFIITLCCTAIFVNHMMDPFNTYDMTFGYILLVPTVIHLSWFFSRKKTVLLLLISILEIAMLLLYGSRGVFVSIAVFFLLRLYLMGKRMNMGVMIVILTVAVVFFSYGAPKLLADYLESQGIYSRTLMSFIDPEYKQTGDREDHWGTGVALIENNPIIGYGLGGFYYDFQDVLVKKYPDQAYIYDPIERVYYKSVATYAGCHSGFLDLLVSFGVIFGLPLALWIIFTIFKVRSEKDRDFLEMLMIFYSVYIAPNMIISSGLHYKPGVAIYIFLFLHCIKYHKHKLTVKNGRGVLIASGAAQSNHYA